MFKDKLSLVPHLPGSYQMKDKNGVIIYVGKAKDLKNIAAQNGFKCEIFKDYGKNDRVAVLKR